MVRSEEYAGRPLANGVLERLAGLEARDAPLRDLDGRTGLRVASGARLALARGERAETDEGDRVALLQAARDAVDQRIDRRGGRRLRLASVLGDLADQILLVHAWLLGRVWQTGLTPVRYLRRTRRRGACAVVRTAPRYTPAFQESQRRTACFSGFSGHRLLLNGGSV